nr:MAG TPA: hypothetical protein [Caudoviricetes sp.]
MNQSNNHTAATPAALSASHQHTARQRHSKHLII